MGKLFESKIQIISAIGAPEGGSHVRKLKRPKIEDLGARDEWGGT